jgi:hypothetical protein
MGHLKKVSEAKGVIQVVKHLPSKLKAMSSKTTATKKLLLFFKSKS